MYACGTRTLTKYHTAANDAVYTSSGQCRSALEACGGGDSDDDGEEESAEKEEEEDGSASAAGCVNVLPPASLDDDETALTAPSVQNSASTLASRRGNTTWPWVMGFKQAREGGTPPDRG